MTAKQIIARFDFHHWPIEEQDGGPAEAWNLSPLPRPVHQKETGRLRTQRAKGKRIREKYNTSQGRAVAAAEGMLDAAARAALSRGMPDASDFLCAKPPKRKGRPMPGSRASGLKRTMRGKTIPRHQPEARP